MAKTTLKRMDRFELLELIYNMRKANHELTERLEAAEKKIEDMEKEADQRVEAVRAEYVQRIDELRMQGAAKDLQKRLSEIEEQLVAVRRMTGKDEPSGKQEDKSLPEKPGGVFTPPSPDGTDGRESGSEAGESRE